MKRHSVDSCVRAIWDDLCTRSGIGDVLDELDDETRKEIQDSWKRHIRSTIKDLEKH
jgi:hypothetical protein